MKDNFDYASLGKRIRKIRKQNNMTQEQLAEACNLSTAHIGHIERGTRALSIESLITISNVLNVSTDYLLLDIVNSFDDKIIRIFNAVSQCDQIKYERFYSVVKILADKIEEL